MQDLLHNDHSIQDTSPWQESSLIFADHSTCHCCESQGQDLCDNLIHHIEKANRPEVFYIVW